jgi:hypothetical protein
MRLGQDGQTRGQAANRAQLVVRQRLEVVLDAVGERPRDVP